MNVSMHTPRLLPFVFARDYGVLAQAGAPDEAVDVWVSEATPPAALAEISRRYGRVRINTLSREQLERAIAQAYASGGSDAAQVVGEVESDLDLARLMQDMPAVEDLLEAADDAPAIRMINALLTQALREGASDIHIEPFEQVSVVRFRIDGRLRDVVRPKKGIHAALISRIKIMSQLDIAEKRLPEDGRITLRWVANRSMCASLRCPQAMANVRCCDCSIKKVGGWICSSWA